MAAVEGRESEKTDAQRKSRQMAAARELLGTGHICFGDVISAHAYASARPDRHEPPFVTAHYHLTTHHRPSIARCHRIAERHFLRRVTCALKTWRGGVRDAEMRSAAARMLARGGERRTTSAMRIAFSAILLASRKAAAAASAAKLAVKNKHRCIQSIIRVRITFSLTISLL